MHLIKIINILKIWQKAGAFSLSISPLDFNEKFSFYYLNAVFFSATCIVYKIQRDPLAKIKQLMRLY